MGSWLTLLQVVNPIFEFLFAQPISNEDSSLFRDRINL